MSADHDLPFRCFQATERTKFSTKNTAAYKLSSFFCTRRLVFICAYIFFVRILFRFDRGMKFKKNECQAAITFKSGFAVLLINAFKYMCAAHSWPLWFIHTNRYTYLIKKLWEPEEKKCEIEREKLTEVSPTFKFYNNKWTDRHTNKLVHIACY